MMRRITQITAVADNGVCVFALCNDGTVFAQAGEGWKELPAIPQDPSMDAAVKMRNEYNAMQGKLRAAEDIINDVASLTGTLLGSTSKERNHIGSRLSKLLKLDDSEVHL